MKGEIMNYSEHAQIRSQQRGIPPLIANWLIDFGCYQHDGRGAIVRYFNKKTIKKIEHSVGRDVLRRLSEFTKCYLVQSATDGSVISIGKRYKNQKINRR